MPSNAAPPALAKNPRKKYCINGKHASKHNTIPTYCIGCISLKYLVPGLLYFTISHQPITNKTIHNSPTAAIAAIPPKTPEKTKPKIDG